MAQSPRPPITSIGHGRRHEGFARIPTARRHTMPAPLTRFIWREREVAEIAALLRIARLLALAPHGAAYIYSGTNYATEKKLLASDGAANDYFGASVAMSGDGTKMIVGAYRKQVGANAELGEGYVYSGANYATEQRLTASDGAANDTFGNAVAMSGDGTHGVIGAAGKQSGANTNQGEAYVYVAPTVPNPLPPVQPAGSPQMGMPAPLPLIPAPVGPPQAGRPAPLLPPRP